MELELIKLIVFDLDGTLLDTIEDLSDSMNHALRSYGLPSLDYSTYMKNVGNGAYNLCRKSLRDSLEKEPAGNAGLYGTAGSKGTACSPGSVTVEEILAAFKAHYSGNMYNKTRPYPGVLEGLSELQHKGIHLAVLSNKPDPNTRELASRYFPDIRFLAVIGESAAFPKKPDPASLVHIMNLCGAGPGQTLLIGDGETDIQTAIAAKVTPLGALWGFRSEEDLRLAGAEHFLKSPSEIGLSLIGQNDYDKK